MWLFLEIILYLGLAGLGVFVFSLLLIRVVRMFFQTMIEPLTEDEVLAIIPSEWITYEEIVGELDHKRYAKIDDRQLRKILRGLVEKDVIEKGLKPSSIPLITYQYRSKGMTTELRTNPVLSGSSSV